MLLLACSAAASIQDYKMCNRIIMKCIKMKKARAKRAELLFFTIKYACKFRKFKGLAKLGNIVAETMFLVMFPGVAKLGNIRFGRKICVREAKMFLTCLLYTSPSPRDA